MRPLFTHNPMAWIVTPRHGMHPAQYACAVERFDRPGMFERLLRRIFL